MRRCEGVNLKWPQGVCFYGATGSVSVGFPAIHIAYAGGRNRSGALGDTRTPMQEETLFNKLVALTVKYTGATIIGHNELDASANCPGFSVKEWIKNYEPDLSLSA